MTYAEPFGPGSRSMGTLPACVGSVSRHAHLRTPSAVQRTTRQCTLVAMISVAPTVTLPAASTAIAPGTT